MIGYQRSTVQSCLARRNTGPLYGGQVVGSVAGSHQHQSAAPTPSPPGYHSSASSIASSSPSSSSSSSSPSSKSPVSPNLLDYYPGINNDGLRLTWFHEANNRNRLNAALMNNHLIIDGDVILAEMSRYPIPIMAKAPVSVSDITLEDWLTEITRADSPKGVRLNFNSTRTVEPAFRVLARHADYLKGPLILNANILSGTSQSSLSAIQSNSNNNNNNNNNNSNNNSNNSTNSSTQPTVDAWTFLMLCRTRFPKSIISIGWLIPDYMMNEIPLINTTPATKSNHHHNSHINHGAMGTSSAGNSSNNSSGLPSPSSPLPSQQIMATNLSMNGRSTSPVTSPHHHLPLNLNLNHLAHLNHHHQQLSQQQFNQLNHHLNQLNHQFTQHRINSLAHLQHHQHLNKDINGNITMKNINPTVDSNNLLIKLAAQSSQSIAQHYNCYSREMIDQMASVVKEYNLTQPITFPVQATMLKNSLGELQRLLYQVGNNSTLTVMADENDLITLDDLLSIRKAFATNQVMYDLPEVLANNLRHELGV